MAAFRQSLRTEEPGWFNQPVPSFGDSAASLLIVGLAPGRNGANRTGRPFTGDYAGDVLYASLTSHGFATGVYAADPGDGFQMADCRVTNALRCLPPANKPTGAEVVACRPFLEAELSAPPAPRLILALGRVAHDAVLKALGLKPAAFPFAHRSHHDLPSGQALLSSYHTSRYNVNTGRLTKAMFDQVVSIARAELTRDAA